MQNSVCETANFSLPAKTQSYEVKTEYTSRAYYLSSKVNKVIHILFTVRLTLKLGFCPHLPRVDKL